jgi:hypothetical protein
MNRDAFEAMSERLTKALLTEDFSLYQEVMQVPLRIEPRKGKAYDLLTKAALQRDFELYCTSLRTQGVTDIFRETMQVLLLEHDWVEVTFRTNILRHAERVVDPFMTQFVLRPHDGDWRVSEIRSTLGHINWTLGRADIAGGKFKND